MTTIIPNRPADPGRPFTVSTTGAWWPWSDYPPPPEALALLDGERHTVSMVTGSGWFVDGAKVTP